MGDRTDDVEYNGQVFELPMGGEYSHAMLTVYIEESEPEPEPEPEPKESVVPSEPKEETGTTEPPVEKNRDSKPKNDESSPSGVQSADRNKENVEKDAEKNPNVDTEEATDDEEQDEQENPYEKASKLLEEWLDDNKGSVIIEDVISLMELRN